MTPSSNSTRKPVYGDTDTDYFTGNVTAQAPFLTATARSNSSSRSSSPLYHHGTFSYHGQGQQPCYTLEILRFSPSNGEVALVDQGNKPRRGDACSRVIPVPLWKTLRRNSSGLKSDKLFSAENETEAPVYVPVDKYLKKEVSCLNVCSNPTSTWADTPRQRETKPPFRCTVREELCRSSLHLPKTLTHTHFIIPGRHLLENMGTEIDFCNSQSSPVADNTTLKSPKQKPSKKTHSSSKETNKKASKRKSLSVKDADLIGGAVKHGPTSPPAIYARSTNKKATCNDKHNNSTSLSVKTATNEQLPSNSANSSDTAAIAINKLNSEHGALYSPKIKKFSEEAEKLLSITKYTGGIPRENSEENVTERTSSSRKSGHSLADNLDTKPSRSSFTASQLPVEKKSSQATNATHEMSPKMIEDLEEESESSSSDEDSETNSVSRRNITAPSSPRHEEEGLASPSEALETVSNFVTKISDISPSFLSPALSSTHARRHVHQSSSSALHKHNAGEKKVRGSRKYRKPRMEDTESTAQTSPHKRAARSASCPMNPMTTPEYIEATRHTVVGSSSSFLKALKGQRNWYPKVVTWFQTLLGRDTSRPPSISVITSKDDLQEPKIDHLSPCIVKTDSRHSTLEDSFSSIVLEKLRPTGRWASAKVSSLLKDVLSTQPCELASETCMICPADDDEPCQGGPLEEEMQCDETLLSTKSRAAKSSKKKKKQERELKGSRKKISDSERPASILEEHEEIKDRDTITASTSPPKKPGIWNKSSKKGEAEAEANCRFSGNKKSPWPLCIWEEPEPPPTDTEEGQRKSVSRQASESKRVMKVDGHDKVCDDTEPMRGEDIEPYCPDNDDVYSIASLDFEGIGGVDERRVKKDPDKKPIELLNLSSMSPSFVSFALSAAGNTIWSQLEKIREANIKYQFPQRRGLYEPPKAYPIWLYAEHIQKLLGFFGKGKSSKSPKDDPCANLTSETLTKKSSFDEAAYRAANESRPTKDKELNRESASSWDTNITAQPKQEEPEYFPQTVENFRELRLCYPSLPLPIYRHPIHRYCQHHCCNRQQRARRKCHQSQSFATCAVCPSHGATFRSPSSRASFRRRSSSPRPSNDDDYHCCVYRACPRPKSVMRCSRRPRMARSTSKKEYVRRGSSYPSNHRITPLSACCARVLKMMHCDAFAHSELRRKSCLLSEKGDRYYYKNLFRKRINMRNFMKEMIKRPGAQIVQEAEDAEVGKDGEASSPYDQCAERFEVPKTECPNLDSIKLEGDSPLMDILANYRVSYGSPNSCRQSCAAPCGTVSPSKKMSEDKIDQSKNKSDNYDTAVLETVEEYQQLSKHLLAETLETWRSERNASDEYKWDLSEHLIKMFSPCEVTPPKPVIDFTSKKECAEGCNLQQADKVDEEMYQCPCGISFVQPCSFQCELAFNRKRELLASKIKDGNIETTAQVLPFAGPYRYEDLHPPMSQLKTERCKPRNDFRHSSFLYEDVLRDKFIPSKDEGTVGLPKSEFKKSSHYDNPPMTTEQVANDVLITLPRVSYKPPIYKHGQEPGSRRYDTNYNKCVRKTHSLKRAENHRSEMGNSFHDAKDTFTKPLTAHVGSSLNAPYRDLGSADVYQNRRSQSIGDVGSTHKAHLLSLKHNYISAKTSSLLHGSANYGNLLNMNSNQRMVHHDFTKAENSMSRQWHSGGRNHYAMNSFRNDYTPDSLQSLSRLYTNSRMPFPYNNAEKVLVASTFHKSNSLTGRKF